MSDAWQTARGLASHWGVWAVLVCLMWVWLGPVLIKEGFDERQKRLAAEQHQRDRIERSLNELTIKLHELEAQITNTENIATRTEIAVNRIEDHLHDGFVRDDSARYS